MTRGAMELIQAQLAGVWDKKVSAAQEGAPKSCDHLHDTRGQGGGEAGLEVHQPVLDIGKAMDTSVANPPSLSTLRSMARSLIAARDSGKGPVRLS